MQKLARLLLGRGLGEFDMSTFFALRVVCVFGFCALLLVKMDKTKYHYELFSHYIFLHITLLLPFSPFHKIRRQFHLHRTLLPLRNTRDTIYQRHGQ